MRRLPADMRERSVKPPPHLLAKSYAGLRQGGAPPPSALLGRHSRDVAEAGRKLSEICGVRALDVCAISKWTIEDLDRGLRAVGWFQDLGKANEGFLNMLASDGVSLQLARHELISALLLTRNPELRAWAESLSSLFFPVIWAAAGHHRKFHGRLDDPPQVNPVRIFTGHDQFRELLASAARDLELADPPELRDLTLGRTKGDGADLALMSARGELIDDCVDQLPDENSTNDDIRFVALLKGFGISADVIASAVGARFRSGYSVPRAIEENLASIHLTEADLASVVRTWAWRAVRNAEPPEDEAGLPDGFVERPFQSEVAASESYTTLAAAGCGSGKSLAAYLWARAWARRRTGEPFRFFFCLPTTGTATEHFRDYALEGGVPARLTHSRASVDLQQIAHSGQEDGSTGSAEAAEQMLREEAVKLEAVELWSRPINVATVDTVLGLMSNNLKSLCALPAIVNAAIVFDEVHAFDDVLFGHLLAFLKHFPRLPVLLMTASLPDHRLKALERVRDDLVFVNGPPELETIRRYEIESLGANDPLIWQRIDEALDAGGHVLWVRNRVGWANRSFDDARNRYGNERVEIYHSRFRYKDRAVIHRRVLDRFRRREERGMILISTQVAEMSLDLSADLLITDLAPVPSLIQRMGRVNRKLAIDSEGCWKPALVQDVSAKDHLPYESSDLEIAKEWISILQRQGGIVSQRDLSDAFRGVEVAEEINLRACEESAIFTSGWWQTDRGMTRSEGTTIPVILEVDDRERQSRGELVSREWVRLHEVSVPIRTEMKHWPTLPQGTRVAPASAVTYSWDEADERGIGAEWIT